ncbi:hypothetical protein [Singulisphaera acidiphila]|uniref:Uncharacterized protein n=1 Tax=Singulisphaera acidiphila (strain ATCC BAA-1392 / DSM 18658 / VKM B-2454 / MOB10) TaxID=886293 RepID=L0DEZ4_SINAD|nr:hypothetical protein [Singulisphaera acidiphila]AGA27373.1 hypothetical protein Sinac_3092 [Singulisphaera acidiphila DSM 18658]
MDLDSVDLNELRYEALSERPSKVQLTDLGRPVAPGATIADWLDGLPNQLAAKGLKSLRDAIVTAHETGRPVVAALGGHVIKTGCAPYLIDWVERGVLDGLALNGSAAIHDLELAIAGKTSEDVGPRLMAGTFGFARETSDLYAWACERAATQGCGLGAALADVILERGGPGLNASLLVAARRKKIPLTVHVAIGTDIVHMTPQLDGAALGKATLDDFRILTNLIAQLAGGVWLNLGSAVVLPEVFLKAVSIVRNLGRSLDGLTTANLDFNQQYRGLLNVLQRPGAQGIALTGHHELMIPLLHAAVATRLQAPVAAPSANGHP